MSTEEELNDCITAQAALLDLHYKCLDRALHIYLERNPDAEGWPDGARSIAEMAEGVGERIAELEDCVTAQSECIEKLGSDLDAAKALLAKFGILVSP